MGSEREFFIDYLFNRKQQVSFQNATSNFETVNCGVPQGSILGPLLFLLSFNDLEDCLEECELLMYADDTVIYTSSKDQADLQEKLNRDFVNLATWFEKNKLIINMKKGKTECMIFGSRKKAPGKSLNITYRNKSISYTDAYTYLGVKLDQSLSLTCHIKETFNKASGRLNLLRRIRPQLTEKAAYTIY